jgi:hypothetical protein
VSPSRLRPLPWGGTTPPSPRPRHVGGEAWPSGVRVSPARPAAARGPHPLPGPRPTRSPAFARGSRYDHARWPIVRPRLRFHRLSPSPPPPRVPERLKQSSQRLPQSLTLASHPSALSPLSIEAPPRVQCTRPAPATRRRPARPSLPLRRDALRGRQAACQAAYRARPPLAGGCGWGALPGGTQARCEETPAGGLA